MSGQGREGLRKVSTQSPTSQRENQRRRKPALVLANYGLVSNSRKTQDSSPTDHMKKTSPSHTDNSKKGHTVTGHAKKTSPNALNKKQNKTKSVKFNTSTVQFSPPDRVSLKHSLASQQTKTKSKQSQSNSNKLSPILEPTTPVRRRDTSNNAWAESLASLNLNLEEVQHIRTQLTKAELEEKNIGEELRTELLLGKICFLCMTVKFGLISWAYDCKICQKNVVSSKYQQYSITLIPGLWKLLRHTEAAT